MLRFLVGTVFLIVSLSSCWQSNHELPSTITTDPSPAEGTDLSAQQANKILDYFDQVAFGAEFGASTQRINKWVTDIRIFVSGQYPDYLDTELTKIINEINTLSDSIQLSRTPSKQEANYLIHFGTGEEYSQIEPNARAYVDDNFGLLWIYWNGDNEIYKGSMYVDIVRTSDQAAQKHLLREELTQSLGLLNDSYQYPESIFYQDWTQTTEYSEMDKHLIEVLYSEQVRPGMTQQDINKVFKSSQPAMR
ncbi:sh3 type 3 domain-containing protein [Leptolyngbya sp. Heron Island J]|uniref:DUF2927 domain-containing protein n=1 Tax=Leptolyngbya sp. Heron Island J TaxID=1385935 RepID=UPI0003B9C625|nr:DUF2927 domain-containing protein [Leptolyngbya sp. Heron Island J]ESA37004.1 sh3 type 3 domain-containing protein [Leptolyngbya sp. Heron Island J]